MKATLVAKRQRSSAAAIPTTINLSLAAVHLLLNLYLYFIFPLYILPLGQAWALTLVGIAAFSNPFWSLIHEAIHDLFHPSRSVNVALGRVLSFFFGSPFRVLRLSHLLHHKLNRTPLEGTELYYPERTSKLRASLGYYFQILGGLYFFEVISPVPFFLPRSLLKSLERRFFSRDTLSGMLVRSLLTDEAIREMRIDGALILGLFTLSAFLYGPYWGFLVGTLMIRGFLISFLDNVYHYRTPVNDVFYADNLWLPGSLSNMLLHFNLHGVHHRNPTLPWTTLPQVFEGRLKQFDGNFFTAALHQLWGPVPLSELPQWRPAVNRSI